MLLCEAQVVPQLEQVLVEQLAERVAVGQMTEPAVPLSADSNAQLDCGNNGREKNSSQT